MISSIYCGGVFCNDQQKALEFWTEKAGFTLLGDYPMGENERWIEVALEGAQTRIVIHLASEHGGTVGAFSNLIFTCADIQKTYEEMTARGVEFSDPPSLQFWGWWATFKDQDGTIYGITQPADPSAG